MASKRARRAAEARKAKKKTGATSQKNGGDELEDFQSRSTRDYAANDKVYPVEEEDEFLSENSGFVSNYKGKDFTTLSSCKQTYSKSEIKQTEDNSVDATTCKMHEAASKAPTCQKNHSESRKRSNSGVTPEQFIAYISGNRADYNTESSTEEKHGFMSHHKFFTNCDSGTRQEISSCDHKTNPKSSHEELHNQPGAIPISFNYSDCDLRNVYSPEEQTSNHNDEMSGTSNTAEECQSLTIESSIDENTAVEFSDGGSHLKVDQGQRKEKASTKITEQDMPLGLANHIEQQSKWWHCCGLLDLILQRS